jgi:hypothetical protein
MLLCQSCVGEHASAGHTVNSVDVVGKEKACAISAALPELRQGVAHQVAQAAQARSLLETLALNRSVALEALAAATARLHADADARHAAMVREIDAAHDAKVVGLQRALSAARAGAAELATMVATAEAALAACTGGTTGSVMYVHVGRSVGVSLALARCRKAVDSDWCRLTFMAACVEESTDGVVTLGRLRTSSTAPAAVSDLCAVEACRVFLRLPGLCVVCVLSVPSVWGSGGGTGLPLAFRPVFRLSAGLASLVFS